MIDFDLLESHRECQITAKHFALEQISPHVQQLEENLSFRLELFKLMAARGYFQFCVGLGADKKDTLAYLLTLKELARLDAGIAVTMAVANMVSELIHHSGTVYQKEKYLGENGKKLGLPFSFALTEQQAGSDVKQILTRAIFEEERNSYTLSGEKKYITNADISALTVVIAKSGINGDSYSAFLLDRDTPGFYITKKENKLGLLTANLVGFRCDRCLLPSSQLLGVEGEGLKLALSALDNGRLGVAAQSLGIAESAFEAAKKFAKQRQQFGGPIANQQVIAFKLADMQVKLSAGELLLYKAAWLKDKGLPFTKEASEAKLFCSEAANQIADEALQIHGGCGYTKDYLVEKYFRDARVTTLYEGTSEIQRLIIARKILA